MQVFPWPGRGREFFEEVIRDNIDRSRPDRVQLVFEKRITRATPRSLRTRIIQDGVRPSLHVEYRSRDPKQYLKDGQPPRPETPFRDSGDFGVNNSLSNSACL